jgi:dTDP-4-dehydrorhamnose reductase
MSGSHPILVAGKTGQLARALTRIAVEREIPLVTAQRPELDLESADSIERIVAAVQPKAIVNAAAYTAVDKAESDPERAFSINRDGAARLAAAAAKFRIPFVHVSTDYVFDGRKPSPYLEEDVPYPLSIYGRSKLEGELAVRNAYADAIIIRTSWVFSPFGQNFVKTMLRLAETNEAVKVVNDQRGSPTAAQDLAETIVAILEASARNFPGGGGLYHFACAGETTWYGFAEAIYAGWAKRGHRVPILNPITTAEYTTSARRPANSRLDCSKIQRTFQIQAPPWQKSLDFCLNDLALALALSDAT